MRLSRVLRETNEAVAEYRRLAEVSPAAFAPHLAVALYNLGNLLSLVGRLEEEAAATREADELCRRSSGPRMVARRVRFERDVQAQEDLSLTGVAEAYEDAGRALRPVIAEYRRLAQADPAAYEPDLAMSLNAAGALDTDTSNFGWALEHTGEAMEIALRLEGRGQAEQARLVRDEALRVTGKVTDALRRTRDHVAADLARRGSQDDDDRLVALLDWVPRLAGALGRLGADLSAAGQQTEALAAAEEEVAVRRRLARANAAAFGAALATSLDVLGARLSAVGREDEAEAARAEAGAIYRRPARGDQSGSGRGTDLPALGRLEVVLPVLDLVLLHRPAAVGARRAATLWGYARVRAEARFDLEAGLRAIVEAVQIYRGLAETRPEGFGAALEGATRTAADLLEGLGRGEEAQDVSRWLESHGDPGSPRVPWRR